MKREAPIRGSSSIALANISAELERDGGNLRTNSQIPDLGLMAKERQFPRPAQVFHWIEAYSFAWGEK